MVKAAMSDVNEEAADGPGTLSAPLVVVDPTVMTAGDDASALNARVQEVETSRTRWRLLTGLLAFVVVCMSLFEGRRIFKVHSEINVLRNTYSDAQAGTKLGKYTERCSDSWEYVCGHYERSSLLAKSSFGDAQQRVDSALAHLLTSSDLSSLPAAVPAKEFWDACRSYNASAFPPSSSHADPMWWWDRGMSFGGLQFGRARSNASRYRYLAVLVERIKPAAGYDCELASISVCDGKLWDYASQLSSQESYDDQLCILGASWQEACERLHSVLSHVNGTNASAPAAPKMTFDSSAEFCLDAVKRLWPTSTSELWESHVSTADDNTILQDVFTAAREAISANLRQHKFGALAKRIDNVNLHLTYVGPPEVYRSTIQTTPNVAHLWEALLLEREAFDRSRLYFTKFDWDMPSHLVNAYYWPYSNDVYVTKAVAWWLMDAADEVARVGRLGMLLGHELGHAVHSNIDAINDIGARSLYNAGLTCLIDEYGRDGLTAHEDMADRIGFAVVGVLAEQLASQSIALCSAYGCYETNERHVAYVAAAQPFCSTSGAFHSPSDSHSSNRMRIRHSLASTQAAQLAWNCPTPTPSKTCTVVGAPGVVL